MPVPFFIFLEKTHTLPKVTSYDANHSHPARVLQTFIDAGDTNGYRRQLANYQEEGLTFRLALTQMKVYETKNQGEEITVRVALQVKAQSINWYFWAKDGKDQYPQEFRDKLYKAAGECHAKVKNGCEMYYRGSNAFHLKTMHHLEIEDEHNHNHYRVKGNGTVRPEDLSEHLQAFKLHEVHDLFFMPGEIDKICTQYNHFYSDWTNKKDGQPSKEEQYMAESTQVLNEADVIEFEIFGLHQEPCRISVAELTADFNAARKIIEESIVSEDRSQLQAKIAQMDAEFQAIIAYRKVGGSRGLLAELAMTRQIEGSHLPTRKSTIKARDDALGMDIPKIPDWAVSARQEVEAVRNKIKAVMPATAASSSPRSAPTAEPEIVKEEDARADKASLANAASLGITIFTSKADNPVGKTAQQRVTTNGSPIKLP